jgi:hypothetical protein
VTVKVKKTGGFNADGMSLAEVMAVALRLRVFRYRPVGGIWRTGYYDPAQQRDPKRWLERNNIPVAEIELCPVTRPRDVSANAWRQLQRST